MDPNPGSPEALAFLIGSGQLLLICGAGIAAYATVHLVSWRFRDFHGGKHLA